MNTNRSAKSSSQKLLHDNNPKIAIRRLRTGKKGKPTLLPAHILRVTANFSAWTLVEWLYKGCKTACL
jgi:hypothetical protein